jgi:septum formation protein
MPETLRLVLASGSPRRRDLLAHVGIPFDVMISAVDEASVRAETPRALALKLAYLKATDVATRLVPPACALGADTVVALDNEVFGKPTDRADAARMLRALRGRTHRVITAVAAAFAGGRCLVDAVETGVTMRDFTDEEMESYLDTGEPLDKAGAYAIQGEGGALIAGHEGCWCNVVGLPLIAALRLLQSDLDVSLYPITCRCEPWPHVRPGPPPWEK